MRYYKYYKITILLVLTVSCRNQYSNKDEVCQEKVYQDEDGYCVFFISDRFQTILKWDEEEYCFSFHTDDSIISLKTDRVLYKKTLLSCNLKYDTIDMANAIELPRPRNGIGFLYNLRITDKKWKVALYYPSKFNDKIKGTYSFYISESEDKVFKRVLSTFLKDAKQEHYPIQDNIHRLYQNSAHALYLKIQSNKEQLEYFGAILPAKYDTITSLYMLAQITTVILGNHILPDACSSKISDTIKLLDIRNRFNSYVCKESGVGFIVEDFDSMIPPPPPPKKGNIKNKHNKPLE